MQAEFLVDTLLAHGLVDRAAVTAITRQFRHITQHKPGATASEAPRLTAEVVYDTMRERSARGQSISEGAAAADLDRVYFVEIEVVSDRCPKLYAGQEGHTTVDAYMQSVGFLPGIFSFHGHLKCEGTGRFFRKQPLSS